MNVMSSPCPCMCVFQHIFVHACVFFQHKLRATRRMWVGCVCHCGGLTARDGVKWSEGEIQDWVQVWGRTSSERGYICRWLLRTRGEGLSSTI